MAVPLADAAVTPVDKQLGILVPSDFSSPIDGFLMGLMDRRRPLAVLRLDRPSIRVGNNVLVSVRSTGHDISQNVGSRVKISMQTHTLSKCCMAMFDGTDL